MLVPLLVLGLGASTYAATLYMKAQNVFNDSYDPVEASAKRDAAIDPLEDNFSILFIGIDDSKDRDLKGNSRSDALMLATFNKDQKSIKLLSIPRDSYVYVPAKGVTTKINAAHAAGGPKATMDTVEVTRCPCRLLCSHELQCFHRCCRFIGWHRSRRPL